MSEIWSFIQSAQSVIHVCLDALLCLCLLAYLPACLLDAYICESVFNAVLSF